MREVPKTTPINMKKLIETLGNDVTKAASMVGCNSSLIYTAIKHGIISKRYEVAAIGALAQLADTQPQGMDADPQPVVIKQPRESVMIPTMPTPGAYQYNPPEPVMVMGMVPAGKLDQFKRVATLMGIELIEV